MEQDLELQEFDKLLNLSNRANIKQILTHCRNAYLSSLQSKSKPVIVDKDKFYNKLKIYIMDSNGKTTTLDVEAEESIDGLKEMIEEKEQYPTHTQRLTFNGALLGNGRTLSDYKIINGSKLEMTFKNQNWDK